MNSVRIMHTRSSHLTVWLGLLGAVVVIATSIFISYAQEQKRRNDKMSYLKPKPSDTDLRSKLTEEQYRVTQQCGTEPAFHNQYWNNHRAGIYVDLITGEPLFSSLDKFDSGTGWPSFTKPISRQHVMEKPDSSYGMVRTEVRSSKSGSHLGHVFDDGPAPTGQRFCINSAALRFIPVEKMEQEGYGEFLSLFSKKDSASANPGSD